MPPILKVPILFLAYLNCFRIPNLESKIKDTVYIDEKYPMAMEDDIWFDFAEMDKDPEYPDTWLEAVLALYYSPAVQAITPARAEQLLPHNKATALTLAAIVYGDLQVIKFLDPQNRNRIGIYEGRLKFMQERSGLTPAEITAALRASISTAVDEEFNKISWLLGRAYNAVLTLTHWKMAIKLWRLMRNMNAKRRNGATACWEILINEARQCLAGCF